MITKIVAKLKTGSIVNVIPFGSANLPAPPYIVVKPEYDIRGRMFRIFVHMLPGQQIALEDYIFNNLSLLLNGFSATGRHGNLNKLLREQEFGDIIISNDDGTISMERRFIMPSMIF